MNILEVLKKIDPSTDVYKKIVDVSGKICSLKFLSSKEVIVKGEGMKEDSAGLMTEFRQLLSALNIKTDDLDDDQLFTRVITAFDQHVVEKNV